MSALKKEPRSIPAIRVPATTHQKLQTLAKREDRAMGEIVTDLVDRYEDEVFWSAYESSLERLRSDPTAWEDYQAEIRLFEGARLASLIEEEPYFTLEEQEAIRAEHAADTQGR